MQSSLRRRVLTSLVAFLVFATASPVAAAGGFGDVEDGSYYTDAVSWMVTQGITNGVEPGCFGPDENVRRGQVAAFLYRLDTSQGNTPQSGEHPFTDVTASYQQAPVGWLYTAGISTGTSATKFAPEAAISRGDFAAMLWRYAGRPTPRIDHSFGDVYRSYQNAAISWMADVGITTGTSPTTFSPENTMTRAQAAAFIFRFVAPADIAEPDELAESSECTREMRVALETGGLSASEARCIAPYLADFDIDTLVKVVSDEQRAPLTLIIAVAESLRAGCLSNTRIAELTRLFL
jgi:hypothetical protein